MWLLCLYEYSQSYRISLQTDCSAKLWRCYILIVPKYVTKQKMAPALFGHCLGEETDIFQGKEMSD